MAKPTDAVTLDAVLKLARRLSPIDKAILIERLAPDVERDLGARQGHRGSSRLGLLTDAEPAASTEPAPHTRILDLTYTALVMQRALYAAAKLGIADHLRDGERSGDEIARATGTHPDALYRLLRVLANGGVVVELPNRRFQLTSLGATLRSDLPGSMRDWVVFSGQPFYVSVWEEILRSIQTGEAAWRQVHGATLFDWLGQHPEAAAIFDAAMTSLSAWEGPAVAAAYDFSAFRSIVDVGGGHGVLLAAILTANPRLRGVLYDQSQVVEGAWKSFRAQGLSDRCTVVGGNFFESVPPGADAYLLKYIIHDWDDDLGVQILENCRRAMDNDAKLLLVETVVPPSDQPHFAKIQDLEMLVLCGSRERTESEYATLLDRARLNLVRVVPTKEPLSIVEAVCRS